MSGGRPSRAGAESSHCPELAREQARRAARDPRYQPRVRRCLRCRDEFESTWCGNRLCESCASFARHDTGAA